MVNLNVGPPLTGMPTLNTLGKDSKEAGSDSFGKTLEQKIGSLAPKSSRMDEPRRKVEGEPDKTDPQKQDPPKAEIAKTEGQKGRKTEEKDRDKAIKKFMDSFESEFGIPSTRLVEAIANLNPEEQTKAPEETADAVIEQLGLDEKDADRARAMYASLLVDLSKVQPPTPRQGPLMMATPPFGEGIKERQAVALEKRNLMNAGVDRLNQSFWMKPAAGEAALEAQPSSQALSRLMDDQLGAADGTAMELPPHLQGQLQSDSGASLSPAVLAALVAKQQAQAKAAAKGDETVEASDESSAGTATDKASFTSAGSGKTDVASAAGLGAAIASMAKTGADDSASSFSKQPNAQNDFAKAMEHQKAGLKEAAKLTDKADFKTTMDRPQNGLESLNAATPMRAEIPRDAAMAGAMAGAATPSPTTAEHDANVRQLMNQAQYLVKKGGGEVKVQMTPEGMGPVHLRVMVQDGKVNVQMQAESPEAKKTIESGLAELKTSLAAHKLSVDHIKVDVVNNTSADVATNNQQQNLHDGAQRESARRFWNQFNENFGSQQQQRDGFMEQSGLRGYASKRDPLAPLENATARSRQAEGRGHSVNVVA